MRQPVQQLIQLYQNNLFTAAFNICQNQMDAEDAVQETFVQYYTSRKEFENEQHIRAWLLRVVINKAKNIKKLFPYCRLQRAHYRRLKIWQNYRKEQK